MLRPFFISQGGDFITDVERAVSILTEIEYGFISYGNLHDDHEQGLELIGKALRNMIPAGRKTKRLMFTCGQCGRYVFRNDNYCHYCGRKLLKGEISDDIETGE